MKGTLSTSATTTTTPETETSPRTETNPQAETSPRIPIFPENIPETDPCPEMSSQAVEVKTVKGNEDGEYMEEESKIKLNMKEEKFDVKPKIERDPLFEQNEYLLEVIKLMKARKKRLKRGRRNCLR